MTWNPTTGCNKVSAGCKFCYAERMSKRLKAKGQPKYQNGFKITTHPEALKVPYTWKKPQLVFVNSMSDLFHPEVPLDFIKEVFKVMQDNPKHRFQLLTKRADILAEYSPLLDWPDNVWIGVSVEDERVVHHIDSLHNTGPLSNSASWSRSSLRYPTSTCKASTG
jgi:protein gp37